jgi:hypothetical protein
VFNYQHVFLTRSEVSITARIHKPNTALNPKATDNKKDQNTYTNVRSIILAHVIIIHIHYYSCAGMTSVTPITDSTEKPTSENTKQRENNKLPQITDRINQINIVTLEDN